MASSSTTTVATAQPVVFFGTVTNPRDVRDPQGEYQQMAKDAAGLVTLKTVIPSADKSVSPTMRPSFSGVHGAPPLAFGEVLLLKHPIATDLTSYFGEGQAFRHWPSVDPAFQEWYERIVADEERKELLKTRRILNLIKMSAKPLPQEPAFIGAAMAFWSTSHNVFHFPSGPMTITVKDLAALLGVSVTGTAVTPLLNPATQSDPVPSEKSQKSYGKFLAKWKGTGPITTDELVAFLVYWLNRFVFCVPAQKISKEYLPIARAFIDREVEFGPYLLAVLYKSLADLAGALSQISGKALIQTGGPVWILQL